MVKSHQQRACERMLAFAELWEKLLVGDESMSLEIKRGGAVAGELTC